MDIILVSDKLAKARTIRITRSQIVLLGFAGVAAMMLITTALNYALLRHAAAGHTFYAKALLGPQQQQQPPEQDANEAPDTYLRDSLSAMAVRLGQMQAQMLRLDTLGERLAKLAGFRAQDLMFGQVPGQGGAHSSLPSRELSFGDLTQQLEALMRQVDDRGDQLGVLESLFTVDSARRKLVPAVLPVDSGWHSSNYGWRIDPFSGRRAFHEGIDFLAEHGTAVRAAAGGVVVYSGFHPQYGNMVEIDHGNDLVTRYAHASKRLVKAGDVVMSGATIAEVGKTGRATGTHLHFEVRHRGMPQNPSRFLRLPG